MAKLSEFLNNNRCVHRKFTNLSVCFFEKAIYKLYVKRYNIL